MIRFETWLKLQKCRDEPIGDLAKDYINAVKMMRENPKKRITIEATFDRFSPCDNALKAYEKAKREFNEWKEKGKVKTFPINGQGKKMNELI